MDYVQLEEFTQTPGEGGLAGPPPRSDHEHLPHVVTSTTYLRLGHLNAAVQRPHHSQIVDERHAKSGPPPALVCCGVIMMPPSAFFVPTYTNHRPNQPPT